MTVTMPRMGKSTWYTAILNATANRIKFNSICTDLLDAKYVEILLNPREKLLAVRKTLRAHPFSPFRIKQYCYVGFACVPTLLYGQVVTKKWTKPAFFSNDDRNMMACGRIRHNFTIILLACIACTCAHPALQQAIEQALPLFA
ncbi:MAG: hypothetical protein GXY32_03595 [Ruminococcaceae bacterium]|nr:hypothetical protein [Oscillospiraceae bacterium]